jgi:hypothetical protein
MATLSRLSRRQNSWSGERAAMACSPVGATSTPGPSEWSSSLVPVLTRTSLASVLLYPGCRSLR